MNQGRLPSYISLFAGAGGTDVGLERAGWHTLIATDVDKTCISTLAAAQSACLPVRSQEGRFHLEDAHLELADVQDLSAADLRPKGLPNDWRPDLLAGGPPCQPWSSA